MSISQFRLRAISAIALSTGLSFALLLGACGDDDDDGGDNAVDDELVAAMVAEGATEEEARCFIDELGGDAVRLVTGPEAELSEDDLEQVREALEACGAISE